MPLRPLPLPLLALAGALAGAHAAGSTTSRPAAPRIHTVLRKDAIPAIRAPRFVAPAKADLPADEPVLGFAVGREAHVYSLRLLNHHEVVNDRIGELPFMATW